MSRSVSIRYSIYLSLISNLLLSPVASPAVIMVTDDLGRQLTIEQPAHRIISLAPHTTELLFAAGAGDNIVGTVRYSDYPQAAGHITRIGDAHNLDLERILSLRPELIVAWHSGNGATAIDKLIALGYSVYISEPKRLETIARSIHDLGALAGTQEIAEQNRQHFLSALAQLKSSHDGEKPVRVFYQIWHEPIFTVNGAHIISEIIQICGGHNIFAELPTISPQVNIEAVLNANPDVIIASGADNDRPVWLDKWQEWLSITAVKNNQLHFIPPELIQRHSPRILEGAAMLCDYLDQARD